SSAEVVKLVTLDFAMTGLDCHHGRDNSNSAGFSAAMIVHMSNVLRPRGYRVFAALYNSAVCTGDLNSFLAFIPDFGIVPNRIVKRIHLPNIFSKKLRLD